MKIDWNKKYNTIAVYVFLVIAAVILFYLGLSRISDLFDKIEVVISILQPFIIGFAIAYILNFILKFYEDRVLKDDYLKKIKIKKKRTLGLIMTYFTAMLFIYLFSHFVMPQLIDSISRLANNVPKYGPNIINTADEVMRKFKISQEQMDTISETLKNVSSHVSKIVIDFIPTIGTYAAKFASRLWNIVLGFIISIYMLADKEKFAAIFKKVVFSIFNKNYSNKILMLASKSNDTFGKFFVGKIIDSAIIGVLTFVVLSIARMPYTLLLSVIIGLTNIIPFFGPFIGAIPSFIIILCVDPIKALWFIAIIFVIQQIDGNLIGPKILGDSIGISAFWILFAILVAGKFMGIVGMIIGVPVFAVIYTIIKENVENRLDKKGLKTDTRDYYDK
ncbi:MAG: AI-2E family transporter [Inconstantimicrobium porci]|uniref:AI-2E family transporter n=1 Tax=Inconstantimicrobium porci TaxID=2652291 RepID=UPI002A915728|nr:AI-2E family transporter [Inconstantimicrobium porci]MDY5912338.1 AI-2E family transporter [Inconstantimicrobium porci]